jgi:predicted ArsR family transcriptional regulator
MDGRPLAERLSAVTALDDPGRRAVYDLVGRSEHALSRDQTAAALGITRRSAAFHLDRLAEEGLLEVEFRRLSGRTGPGAGRPSKLYRRVRDEVTVSVPDRRYELAAELLATAIESAAGSGEPVQDILLRISRQAGRQIAADSRAGDLAQVLDDLGFEPRSDPEGGLLLGNCPFHRLAVRHTDLICHANLELLTGIADEVGLTDQQLVLDPSPELCCVRVRPVAAGAAG